MTPTSSANIAIAATGISKRFGGALAVDDVSLRIAPGEIHSIVGENGAGNRRSCASWPGSSNPTADRSRFSERR